MHTFNILYIQQNPTNSNSQGKQKIQFGLAGVRVNGFGVEFGSNPGEIGFSSSQRVVRVSGGVQVSGEFELIEFGLAGFYCTYKIRVWKNLEKTATFNIECFIFKLVFTILEVCVAAHLYSWANTDYVQSGAATPARYQPFQLLDRLRILIASCD